MSARLSVGIRLSLGLCLGVLVIGFGGSGCFAGTPAGQTGQGMTVAQTASATVTSESATVSSDEKNQISAGFTPEYGWRGEIDLRPEVTVGGPGPAGEEGSQPTSPRFYLRLGVTGESFDFWETATPWELRPEEIALFAEGPLWEGGPPVNGVLGDFRLPLPDYLGGDSRRNGVRGVALTDINIRPMAVTSLFFGWTTQSVSPLSRSEEPAGSDYLTGGGRLRWTPAPDYNLELAAAWREGSVHPALLAGVDTSQADVGWFYREDVGAVAHNRPWQDLRVSARAGWQSRQITELVRQLTGFAALELVSERRDQQRHRHWQAIRTYVVPAEFFPWAARRSTTINPFYRWRGEAGAEWEGVTWLGTPVPDHRVQWQLGAGWRVKELPEYDELVSDLISNVISPAEPGRVGATHPLDTPFWRGRGELSGEIPASASGLYGWLEHCEYRWRAQVESDQGGWTDFRLRRTFKEQVGPVTEWTPSYSVRWESPRWVTRTSGSEGGSPDEAEAGSDDGPPSGDDSSPGTGLTHTFSLALKLSLGSIQGIKTSWSRSITARGQFTDTWSIAYDSPNGWEWRLKWTSPDDPEKSTDTYCEVRQRFEL